MTGRVSNKKGVYQPERPLLFRGNFPNAPKSSAFGSVGILGAIGEMVKEESVSKMAKRVLHSLKDTRIYLIQYGGAAVFTYNHHVIDLASKGKLMSIVGDLYHSRLYQGERKEKPEEYQKFDLFASRFLQLFNRVSFKDFLAIRAEYPSSLDVLFKTYFLKMEGFEKKREVVSSAMSLGRWLNEVAYYAAKMKVEPPDDGEKIWTTKSKFLVELESSTFSAKSGHALLAQTVTRAGRLSGWDAPEEAGLFMKEVAVGSLNLEEAKNLLVAFSRLKYERKSENIEDSPEEDEETNTDDISDV
jgi:hypothetical protein